MKFVLIKIDSDLWDSLWSELESHPINEGLENPTIASNNGCQWEYRGSYQQDKILISDFLHRKHPKTNMLYKFSIKTLLDNENDIEQSFKL